jgi:hypothetical protein
MMTLTDAAFCFGLCVHDLSRCIEIKGLQALGSQSHSYCLCLPRVCRTRLIPRSCFTGNETGA